jgi:hypothetical protein
VFASDGMRHVSEVRAKILGHLIQSSANKTTVRTESLLNEFCLLHCVQREVFDEALDDLRHFGLVQTTPDTVELTNFAKRLSL